MRLIGHLQNEKQAKTFGDYLAGLEIKNLTEPEADGTWAVWIYSEDHLEKGRDLLKGFRANPDDAKFHQFAGKAAALEARENKEQTDWEKRVHNRTNLWSNTRFGPLTLVLIGISVVVFLVKEFGNAELLRFLYISEYFNSGLFEVREGQIWRLITPIFLHSGYLHIFFNMLWLKDLGTLIEMRQGSLRFGLMVLFLAAASNFGQYLVSGPLFGGMSGVVYGLLGYVWIRGKFDPFSNYHIDPTVVTMMLVWFVVCLVGLIPHVANAAHGVGLVAGAILGYWPVFLRNLTRR